MTALVNMVKDYNGLCYNFIAVLYFVTEHKNENTFLNYHLELRKIPDLPLGCIFC